MAAPHRANWRTTAVLVSVALLSGGCMSNAAPSEASLTGTATYRERIALPPGAVFEATLEDVTRADAPAEVLGRTRIDSPGNPPFKFTIPYDPARIDPAHRYAVRAKVTVDGDLMFTTDTHYPVLSEGAPRHADMLMKMAARPTAEASTATLENTYWKLMRLGAEAVSVADGQREPHFILQPEQKRVAGSGGCNRLVGSYALEGETLVFSQMAGTRMACPQGMDVEQAFYAALGKVATWRIDGETLELFDASGSLVAQFESRYMK
jgi:putative lipoprotein